MRVSDTMISGSLVINLNKTKDKLQKLRVEIAEGTKINKPSDSPEGAVRLLRLNNQYGQSETYSNNIQNSLSSIHETEFNMETIQGEIVKVMTTMTDASNQGISNLNSFADKIDSSIKIILDASNSSYDGKYNFGGTDHSSKPYSFNAAGTAIIENTIPDGSQIVKVSENSFQKINVTGRELFGTVSENDKTDIFNTLIKIRDEMKSGIRPTDAEIKSVSDFNLKILDKQSETGNLINQLQDTADLLTNHKAQLQDLISKEQGVDIAQAMVDLQNQDYLLQMTLKVSSSILPKSLMDYL